MVLIYAKGWVGRVILAVINGTLREKAYGKLMHELSAHQLSTFSGLLLFGLYVWILSGFFRIESSRQAVFIGGIWLMMTVIFEFVFGHYVMGHARERLFHDYNVFKGRIWVLVIIWTAIAPYVFYRIRS